MKLGLNVSNNCLLYLQLNLFTIQNKSFFLCFCFSNPLAAFRLT